MKSAPRDQRIQRQKSGPIMMNLVDDIIYALDFEFTEQPSSKSSVMALDGEMVRLNCELWKKSPVLREHASSDISHKVLAAPKSALDALNKAHTDGIFPNGIRESYELLAAASELHLGELTSECLDHLRTLNGFDESVDLPSELSVDTVMRVFNVLLDGPLRTVDIYKSQLSRIARYCANNRDVMTNAMNALKQSLGRFRDIDLEGIPASFGARALLVAICRRNGKPQTAVILGAEVIPVNLFGNRFNLAWVGIATAFYLKYGVYLLYKCGSSVFHKYLLDDSEPKEILSNCHCLATTGKVVLAVQKERDSGSIFLWTDDKKFEKIYQPAYMIERVSFDGITRLLGVVLSGGRFRLFRLENKTLSLLVEKTLRDGIGLFLSGGNIFIRRKIENGTVTGVRSVVALSDGELSQWIDEQLAGKDDPMIVKTSESFLGIYNIDGSYFLGDSSSLKLASNFPYLDRTRMVMTRDEIVAVSELWMYP